MSERKIESVEMRAGDIKFGFGNPRKIGKKNREALARSLEEYGNFGIFVIDEDDNVIAGNQRLAIIAENSPDEKVLCKRLVGYSVAEKRAINIKDNTHAGDWDLEMLADWTADLNVDLGINAGYENPDERKVTEIEPIHYEK